MKSLLIVEDDRGTRRLLRGLLETRGFTVSEAATGPEALACLDAASFDLLLTDVWLPGMTGFEVIERLGPRAASLPVVLITADDTPETLLRAVREQAYTLIQKPIEAERLFRVIEAALAAPPAQRPIRVVSAKPDWVELLVPCELRAAERLQSFLSHLDADLPDSVRETVGTAFRELLMNAIEWGGHFDPTRDVRISYLRARRMLLYRIADPGAGFRPDQVTHSAIANPEDDPIRHLREREEKGMRAGGFGILMAKALVDELLYNEAHNEVVLVKYLD